MSLFFSKSINYIKTYIISWIFRYRKITFADLLKAVYRTELYKWELSFDYFPILYSLKGIKKSAAFSTIKTIFDEITYNLIIGREINIKNFLFSSVTSKKIFIFKIYSRNF